MIAVVTVSEFVAWLAAHEEAAVLNELRTPSIQSGGIAAARLASGAVVPNGCPATVYPYLSQAMAAHPGLPWHELSVWGGAAPEPELIATIAAMPNPQVQA